MTRAGAWALAVTLLVALLPARALAEDFRVGPRPAWVAEPPQPIPGGAGPAGASSPAGAPPAGPASPAGAVPPAGAAPPGGAASPGGAGPPTATGPGNAADAIGGLRLEIVDDQVRLGARVEHYTHRALRVLSNAGVQSGSEVLVAFDPTYEQLVLHGVRVVRDGVARDALDRKSVRVVHHESPESRLYDGSVTVVLVLGDVRTGDLIDYEYSVFGQNPVFAGAFADTFLPGSVELEVDRFRYRLLVPEGRSMSSTEPRGTPGPSSRELPGFRELTWDREHVQPPRVEGDTPHDIDPVPLIRVAEQRTWQQVATWASSLLTVKEDAALRAKVAEIRAAHPTPEARALAAIRFVQDEIRYLGIEVGEHSHRPRPPAEALAHRYGDCKDKALLLVTMLRALGLKADSALVNTRAPVQPDLPSHLSFNHVVVRLEIAGRVHWIDATIREQGGDVENLQIPRYGLALVVSPETDRLTSVSSPPVSGPTVSVHEIYDVGDPPAARLTVENVVLGMDADWLRASLSEKGRAALARDSLEDYARAEPSIEPAGELEIDDDRVANRIVIRERYRISDFIRDGSACIGARTLVTHVHKPEVIVRGTPLGLPYPLSIEHVVELHAAGIGSIPEDVVHAGRALTFERTATRNGDAARISFTLRASNDRLTPAEVAGHLAIVDSMRDELGGCMETGVTPEPPRGWAWLYWSAGAIAGLAVALAAFTLGPKWVRKRRWRRKLQVARGETANEAMRAPSRARALEAFGKLRCACGVPLPTDLAEWGAIRLGDRRIASLTWVCSCRTTTRRYYELDDEN